MKCKKCGCLLEFIQGGYVHGVGHLSFCKEECINPIPDYPDDWLY